MRQEASTKPGGARRFQGGSVTRSRSAARRSTASQGHQRALDRRVPRHPHFYFSGHRRERRQLPAAAPERDLVGGSTR